MPCSCQPRLALPFLPFLPTALASAVSLAAVAALPVQAQPSPSGGERPTGEYRGHRRRLRASTSFIPPLSAIERIEVIRGPMSTLYGSGGLAGTGPGRLKPRGTLASPSVNSGQ